MQGAGHPARLLARGGAIAVRLLPLAAAGAYVLVLARNLPAIVAGVALSPDFDSHMVMAEWLGTMPKTGRAILAESGYLWFDLATRSLPFHREIWTYSPYAMALVTLALLIACSWRLAGPWAGALTFALGIAASPIVLTSQVAQALHGSTWFGASLLAALLAWLLTQPGPGRAGVAALITIVSVAVGAGTASDPLLGVTGVLPFGLTGLAAAYLGRSAGTAKAGRRALAAAALSIVVAGAIAVATRAAGFASTVPHGISVLVPRDHVGLNLSLLLGGIVDVANGRPPESSSRLEMLAGMVCAGLMLAAAALPLVLAGRWLAGLRRGDREVGRPLQIYVIFWALSEVCLAGAFTLSDIPVDFGASSARYLVPFFYAAAAVVPIWATRTRGRHLLTSAAIALFALTGARVLQVESAAGSFVPGNARALPAAAAFLESEHLTRGYTTYWDASPMTWQSRGAVHVYPVTEEPLSADERCGPPQPDTVCPFTVNSISDWYRPAPGTQTFVMVDPGVRYLTAPPSAALGVPVAVHHVDRFTIYVYADDVANRFHLPRKFTR